MPTTQIASTEEIIETNNIPPSHIADLYETGVTPSRDTEGKLTVKVAMRRSMRATAGKNQIRSAHFKNFSRVTRIPLVFADGSCGRTSFVVQGRRVPYRVIEVNGVRSTQSFAGYLPTEGFVIQQGRMLRGLTSSVLNGGQLTLEWNVNPGQHWIGRCYYYVMAIKTT